MAKKEKADKKEAAVAEAAPVAELIQGQVAGDGEEPGPEGAAGLVRGALPEDPEEGLLEEVLGESEIPHVGDQEGEEAPLVSAIQEGKGGLIARLDRPHQFFVGRSHHRSFQATAPGDRVQREGAGRRHLREGATSWGTPRAGCAGALHSRAAGRGGKGEASEAGRPGGG